MPVRACVFDAYGTLFDVTAAAREATAGPGREALAARAERLSGIWRLKQLQYSWIRALAGAHADFEAVTADALDFALEAMGLAGEPGLRGRLLARYRELAAYPEVPEMLAALRAAGLRRAILSNGAPGMLAAALAASGIGAEFEAVISVEEAGIYKPAPRVYALVGERLGLAPAEVLFVSANGWDAAAGQGFGFTAVRVNRTGEPADRLPWRPAHEVRDLAALPALARSLA